MLSMVAPVGLPPVEIDIRAQEPSYLQLAAWLRRGIKEKRWAPGEPVPSITWLCGQSGLAVATVRRAVKVLVDEGLLYTVQGRGTFVAGKKGEPKK